MRLPKRTTVLPFTAALAFAFLTYHSLPRCQQVSLTELSSIFGGNDADPGEPPSGNGKCQKTATCGFDCCENPVGSSLCESCSGTQVKFCEFINDSAYDCTCENQTDQNGNYVKCGTKYTGTKGFFGCLFGCSTAGPACGG